MPGLTSPPFLDDTPPPVLARALATSLLVVAAAATLAGVLIRVPETVTGRFVLVPAQGADPVRAPKEGVVTRVLAAVARPVHRGDTLFVVASEPALDRGADRAGLEATAATAPVTRADVLDQLEAARLADSVERERLETRVATLERSIVAKREQQGILRDLTERARQGTRSGVTSEEYLARLRLDASQLDDALQAAEGELSDVRAQLGRRAFESRAREAAARERLRRLDLDLRLTRARLGALAVTGAPTAAGLLVASPCDGTVLRLHVRAAGAYVGAGDLLADLACSSDSLLVEVDVPAAGIGQVAAGQDVRLLYDAFPYQRYGVRFGEVAWVGATVEVSAFGDSTGFRARVRPDDLRIRVAGEERALVPGMGGTARIIVARRRLIAYAFAPLAQLREAMADRAPAAKP